MRISDWSSDVCSSDQDLAAPEISPLYADLNNLCPALFTVGTQDPLLDDSLFMYMRWLSSGNDSELAAYAGGIHNFIAFQPHSARGGRSRHCFPEASLLPVMTARIRGDGFLRRRFKEFQ